MYIQQQNQQLQQQQQQQQSFSTTNSSSSSSSSSMHKPYAVHDDDDMDHSYASSSQNVIYRTVAEVIPNLELAPQAERTTQKIALVALLLIGAAIGVIGFAPIAIPAAIVTYVLIGTAGAVTATALMLFIRTISHENRVHKTLEEFKQLSTFRPLREDPILWDDNFFQSLYKGVYNMYAGAVNWLYQAPLTPATQAMDTNPETASKLFRNQSIIEVVGKIALLAIAAGGAALVATAVMGMIPFVATPLLINAAVFTGSAIAAVALWLFVEQVVHSYVESSQGYEYYDARGKHQFTQYARAHEQANNSYGGGMMYPMSSNSSSSSNHNNNNNNNNNNNGHFNDGWAGNTHNYYY